MQTRISTKPFTNKSLTEIILSKLVYSLEDIDGCWLDNETNEIVIDYRDIGQKEKIEETILQLIEREQHNRVLPSRTIKNNLDHATLPELKENLDEVFSPVQNIRSGIGVQLYSAVNELLQEITMHHSTERRKYSSLIKTEHLIRCGYIQSFPQNLYLVSEVPHQIEALDNIKDIENISESIRQSPYALSTATCLHCYAELADKSLSTPYIVSADSTCFRHEAPWRLSKYRLNEFWMKELVIIGDPTFVEEKRQKLIDEVWTLFCEIGLAGKIDSASDLFYYSEDTMKSQHQIMSNLKYELNVTVNAGKESFSIASFNNTRTSLVESFGITDPKVPLLHSACIAFGIDRWVYAILATFGSTPSDWPDFLRNRVNL